jgi:K+-dependent Na+/Ca+ exchanger-like protein
MDVLLSVLLLLVAFYLLAIVTEYFFVPAIDKIAHRFKISSDAAGATLLASGSSAPEFFVTLFAVLGVAGATPDIGAGAIVGSAIFNVLVIIGVTASFKTVTLQWQPVIRDQFFYVLTIILLLWAFWDGQIVLHEAVVFVATFIVYVLMALHWRKIFDYKDHAPPPIDEKAGRHSVNRYTYKILKKIIPDPHTKSSLYGLSFVMSILVIAGLSWLLVGQVVHIAEAMRINATLLALTVVAAGTSVPDLISSVVVARQGRGDMAVSNAIGSNIFDVLFGLGVPWLVVFGLGRETVSVSRENLIASVFLLLATVVAIFTLLVIRRWRIGHRSGFILMGLYVVYCAYLFLTVT